MFRCVRGHGGRQAWLTTVSPAHLTPFPYRPMHVRPVWCWPACVRSVYGHVSSAAVVLLVHGRVSRLLVGWFGVGSLALQQALAQLDLLRARVLLVAVLVGASCVGSARYVFTVRRSSPWEGKVMISGLTAVKTFFKFCALFPAPPWQRCMRNPSSGTSRCSLAVLPASPVPFICTPPCRWQGPVGPPWCVPVLPMGAPVSRSGSVVRCSCSCLPACRAPYRAVFCGSCGWRACVPVLSLAVRMVRLVRLVLWCRDVPSGVAGWPLRNTSVPAGRGSTWPRVASLWSPARPRWGFRG